MQCSQILRHGFHNYAKRKHYSFIIQIRSGWTQLSSRVPKKATNWELVNKTRAFEILCKCSWRTFLSINTRTYNKYYCFLGRIISSLLSISADQVCKHSLENKNLEMQTLKIVTRVYSPAASVSFVTYYTHPPFYKHLLHFSELTHISLIWGLQSTAGSNSISK